VTVLGLIIFWIILIASVAAIPFGIPGTFIIVVSSLVYGWIHSFDKLSLPFLGLLLAIAVGLEIMEELFGAYMARRLGGSKWAVAGAIIGGLLGAIAGTPVTPVAGTLLGGFAGAFIGAMSLEWIHSRNTGKAFKVGLGALFGAVGGKISKLLVSLLMLVMIAFKLFS